MVRLVLLRQLALSVILGVARGNPLLAPICGDQRCMQPCPEGDPSATDCLPARSPNATGPAISRDCYEHNVFGGECAACNVTASCPSWCDELRAAGCRPYEMVCGYVETVEFEGPREDLVTRGPLFCRRVDCAAFAPGEGGDACWFAVDGHEVCCVDGVPTYVTGSGRVVPGFQGAEAPAPAAVALVPGAVEESGAEALQGGLWGTWLWLAAAAFCVGLNWEAAELLFGERS